MKATSLHALIHLSKHAVRSSVELSKELRVSQQTASRWLIRLCREGLAEKTDAYRLGARGKGYLSSLFTADEISFKGAVFTGLKEGGYYLNREGYMRQFLPLLGFKPYPGTLNLRLTSGEDREANRSLRAREGLLLKGFKERARSFGGARCYLALIQGKKGKSRGAVIVPERTHYPEDVVELLAPVCLRRRLRLKDGDVVSVYPG